MALKAGFEVLLDSEDVGELRNRLSALLDPADVVRSERIWTSRAGKRQRAELSDLEWWFTEFAFLRNAIAHGDEFAEEQFDYDGTRRLWIAEARFPQARGSGEEDILVGPLERAYRRAMRALGGGAGAVIPLSGSRGRPGGSEALTVRPVTSVAPTASRLDGAIRLGIAG